MRKGLYYMSANNKGSGETALMRRLVWAFAGRLCDTFFSCAGLFIEINIV